MFNSILFVCIGNICRSPTAEYLMKHKLRGSNVVVSSSGLSALVGKPIDASAGLLLSEHGVDASPHEARQIRTDHLMKADLILTMDQEMANTISSMAPQVSGKTFLLGKWHNNATVADPYRKSREAFEHVYRSIDKYTDDWLKYL
ncbi:low molecular weight protein-tyrosine-phosphatase [Halioxenophilus aromaticivorans]|uniref:protein-tyrosine-phosphatase n=1 Tax=Halioxenophilus aromaticivorans TaxID=1306992 RepID=A0AAV3U130_9ALTE